MKDEQRYVDEHPRSVSRRTVLKAVGASTFTLVGANFLLRSAAASEQLVVADPGGPFTPSFTRAFYAPFQKQSGIKIINVARPHQPTSQVQAQVNAHSYSWDVVTITEAGVKLLGSRGLLEKIDWSGGHMDEIMKEARSPYWMGTDVYATILAYRTDKLGENGPSSWADFWDLKQFPGRRALRRSPIDTLEIALLADGVSPAQLYPLDLDRAFKKLDQIKSHIAVWWTGGAQTTQLLQSGEVEMLPTWNGRAQVAIDAGSPVQIVWNQGLYSIEGWAIPKGDPHADAGREFIKFCSNPKRQAEYTKTLAYGPTNPKAYDYISSERAKVLPTAPDHIKTMIHSSQDWWGEHKEEAVQRFENWILS